MGSNPIEGFVLFCKKNSCNKQFTPTRKRHVYCSKKCATDDNHRKRKKQIGHTCLDCNTIIRSVSTRCRRCYTKFRGYGENPTLGEVEDNHNHRASAYSIVRIRARVIAKKNNMNFCIACGYNKHVEICHIKPTSSFNKNTRLSVINSLDNLVSLCRNCHWEFDNGLLKLKKA